MGLLEDAIREHLELKRLRGADPAEVARAQHEALDPPAGRQPNGGVADHAHEGAHDEIAGEDHALDGDGQTTGENADDVPPPPSASDFSHVGEETAELDMQAVLGDEQSTAGEPAATADAPPAEGQEPPAGPAEEDSLEWEVPARAHDADTDSGPYQSESRDAGGGSPHEHPPESGEEVHDGRADAQQDGSGQGRLSL
jgi:hypothetical protein